MYFSINSYKMLYLVCNEVYISIFTDILEKMEGLVAPCTPKSRNKLIQGSVAPCTPKPMNNLLQRVCQPTPKGGICIFKSTNSFLKRSEHLSSS